MLGHLHLLQGNCLQKLLGHGAVGHQNVPDEVITQFDTLITAVKDGTRDASTIGEDLYWQQIVANLHSVADPGKDHVRLQAVLVQFHSQWRNINATVVRGLQRQTEITAAIATRAVAEAAVGLVSIVAAALIYIYVMNYHLARPAAKIAGAMRAVAQGDLDARANVGGDGPMAELAINMNTMVDILQESLHDEQRVIRELQTANEHKNQFLANISHELKTPLNAVIGLADILSSGKHGELTDKQANYLEHISKAGQHLLTMITDLLDIARIDVGEMRLNIEPTKISTAIQECVDMLSPAFETKQHEVTVDCAADLPVITVDRARFKQIIINLLSNAVKFTPDGGTIDISCSSEREGVSIVVRDNGIGIAVEAQERIFTDFVQVDSTVRRAHEGVGIGLALSRRFVGLFDGTIRVDSEPGKGSTFEVWLPVDRTAQPKRLQGDSADFELG